MKLILLNEHLQNLTNNHSSYLDGNHNKHHNIYYIYIGSKDDL